MEMVNDAHWQADLETLLKGAKDRHLDDLFKEICELGVAMGDKAGEALLNAHPEYFSYTPWLTEAFGRMIVQWDITETGRLLSLGPDDPVPFKDAATSRTLKHYNRLNDVFDYFDFRGRGKMVMVGCGRKPFTTFHFHDRTDIAEIIGLDIFPEAIETANAMAEKFGYDRMRAELCNGRDYDYSQADVVYVSTMAMPKAQVVSRIADTAPENVQIILWEPVSLSKLWSECAEDGLDPRLEVIGRGHVSSGLTRDVFVRRRDVSATGKKSG
jgi:hypothetical protein